MSIAAEVFAWLSAVTGAVALFAGMLWTLGWACVQAMQYLRVWHTLKLCVAVQLHGKEYRDDLFWKAVRERAERSNFAATTIADYALKHGPTQPEPPQ